MRIVQHYCRKPTKKLYEFFFDYAIYFLKNNCGLTHNVDFFHHNNKKEESIFVYRKKYKKKYSIF
jgi:hypothetical protein